MNLSSGKWCQAQSCPSDAWVGFHPIKMQCCFPIPPVSVQGEGVLGSGIEVNGFLDSHAALTD